jgi:hypothetical protein
MFGGYPGGMPIAAPNFTRSFTQPTSGVPQQGGFIASGNTITSDLILSGYVPRFMQLDAPGTGVNVMRQRYEAGSRLVDRAAGYAGTALNVASVGTGLIGGATALGLGGAALAPIAAAAGAVALPLMAASAAANSYNEKREQVRQVQQIMSGLATGPLAGPLGTGIDQSVARQIQRGLSNLPGRDTFTSEDYVSTLSQAQDIGLMRGRTNSVNDIVGRVKELAKISKVIMDLGEGITQKDALDMQMLAQNMGISAGKFSSQGIANKILASARLSGQTMGGIMSGAGSEGASLFAQLGMNAGSGMMTGITSASVAAGLINSGKLSERELAMFGGESGLGNILMKNVAGFQANNATNLLMGSLLGPNSLQSMVTGASKIGASAQQMQKLLSGKGITKQQRDVFYQLFEEMAPEAVSQMQENMSPERMQLMMINQAKALMGSSKKPMTAFTAFKQVTGSEEGARALLKLAQDPSSLKASFKQIDTIDREARLRSIAELEEYQSIFSSAGRAISALTTSAEGAFGINAAVDYTSQQDADQAARAAGYDVAGRKRRFLGLDSARERIRDRLRKGESSTDILRALSPATNMAPPAAAQSPARSGASSAFLPRDKFDYRLRQIQEGPTQASIAPFVSEEDITMFGNLKNSGNIIDTIERLGFDLDEFGVTSRSMVPGGGLRRAQAQLSQFLDIRNSLSTASSGFIEFGRFNERKGSAAEYLNRSTEGSSTSRAVFKAVNKAVEEAVGTSGGSLTGLTNENLQKLILKEMGNISPDSPEFKQALTQVPRMLGAVLAEANTSGARDTMIKGLAAGTATLNDYNLGTGTVDYSLSRFGNKIGIAGREIQVEGEGFEGYGPMTTTTTTRDIFEDSTDNRRSLSDVQEAAVSLGLTKQEHFDLLLSTNGDEAALKKIMREETGSRRQAAREILSKIEGNRDMGGKLTSSVRGLRSKIYEGATPEELSKISGMLSDTGSIKTLQALQESDVVSEGLAKLGLILPTTEDTTPGAKTALAQQFFEGLSKSVEGVTSVSSSEDLIQQLIQGAGGDATALLSSPSFSQGLDSTAEDLRSYMPGGFRAGDSDAKQKREDLVKKLSSQVLEAGLKESEGKGAGPSSGTKDAIEAQINSLKEIADMNKKTADTLAKLVGDNGTVQTLTAAVQKLQDSKGPWPWS